MVQSEGVTPDRGQFGTPIDTVHDGHEIQKTLAHRQTGDVGQFDPAGIRGGKRGNGLYEPRYSGRSAPMPGPSGSLPPMLFHELVELCR